jgi:hypothetical protein
MDEKLIAERQGEYLPRNYRIISHRTQKRILHVEDVLEIERIRFELWDYARGAGAKAHVEAYLDVHTARLLAAELATGRLREMDGRESFGGGFAGGEAVSRILRTENSGTRNPIRITISNGPGVQQKGGLISPAKGERQTKLSVLLSAFDARRVGLAILHHLQAWATSTYKARVAAGSWQPAVEEESSRPTHGTPQLRGGEESALRYAASADPLLPPTPSLGVARESGNEPLLRYANGDYVSDNAAELKAFSAYVGSEGRLPADVVALRAWVRAVQE